MYLALCICLLFISLMQSVNGIQFLINILFLLLGAAAIPVFGTVIAPQVCIHHYKLDLSIGILNLI